MFQRITFFGFFHEFTKYREEMNLFGEDAEAICELVVGNNKREMNE